MPAVRDTHPPRASLKLGAVALSCALAAFVMLTRAAPLAAGPDLLTQGKAVYDGKGNCARCHGVDGRGTDYGVDLTDRQWLHVDGTVAGIAAVVRSGVAEPVEVPMPMPAMGGAHLTSEEVASVSAYAYWLGHR